MTTIDPIADLLTRIRNAHLKHKISLNVPYSKIKQALVSILKEEGYIKSFFVNDEPASKKAINIKLNYHQGKPVIRSLRRVSKPGQRIYQHYKDLPYVLNGLGIAIVSTSHGMMTSSQARAQKLGGEIICEIY